MCRRGSLGVLERLPEGFADALELACDAVARQTLARRNLLFRQVFHEFEAGYFEPRCGTRDDGQSLAV